MQAHICQGSNLFVNHFVLGSLLVLAKNEDSFMVASDIKTASRFFLNLICVIEAFFCKPTYE